MEPDMVVEMVKDVVDKDIFITELAGDDDSTGFNKLKQIMPELTIEKTCDKNHIRRNVASQLYDIKSKHQELSTKVIDAIMKNFSYLMEQNQGSPNTIKRRLKASVEHIYGNHDYCDESWCGFLKNSETYRHSNLPHGKDLSSMPLKKI